jgi:hypothetical protein
MTAAGGYCKRMVLELSGRAHSRGSKIMSVIIPRDPFEMRS